MFEVLAVDRLAHKFERNRVPGHTTAKWFLYAWAADRFLGNATADHLVGTEQFCMRFGQPKKIEVGDFEHLERKQV